MIIRDETEQDVDQIHALTMIAFAPMDFSTGTEPGILRGLRADGDLTISLVAEDDGTIIGHVAISPLTIDGASGWFGLGPISVAPDRQRQGIGSTLVRHCLDRLRQQGATGCALIGNPEVYRGMGFESDGNLTYGDAPKEIVQRVVFTGTPPSGELRYAPAFARES